MTTTVFTSPAPALPCSWEVDTSCCEGWDTLSPSLQTAAAEYGAFTVWAATGRRFGLCERTVRPCGRYSQNNGVYGYYWSEGTWLPYIFNGAWRNCWCGNSNQLGCGTCEPECQVLLIGPVGAIAATGVIVDDAVVPASSYRVDNGIWLVRTDGDCWPTSQDFSVDSGTNTFSVTYSVGIPVPSVLQAAAGELACEWVKACQGQACRLPSRVTSIARQGVSISMVETADLLRNGLTGVFTVDQVIRSFNPYGLVSRMRVASPDLEPPRTTTLP